ncbi:MAG: hypothetical protein ACERKD_04790 [Prolixibacteraceae bacterium]
MLLRKTLFLFLILLASHSFSQTGLSLKFGATAWRFTHNFEDISTPMSLAYSGGLNLEQVLFNSSVGVMTGVDYLYAKPGLKYTDLSGQKNLLAVIYEKELNERYVQIVHHEITVPFMFVFYHNGLRTGVGASYSWYLFDNKMNGDGFEQLNDYGLVACTGARLSKRMIFSIGYYYGLKNVIGLSALPEMGDEALLSGNVQQLKVHLAISLFNNLKDSKYFIAP